MAGMFFLTVSMTACTSAETVPLHSREAPGGVHFALASTLLVQLASQVLLTLQLGGVTVVSHWGALYATLQPPRQLTLAPQLT